MANTKRKDKSRKVLRKGESQRPDGTYQFRWTDENRKRHCIYARNLDDLRYKEDEIDKDKKDGIKTEARYTSLNDMYELWRDLKRGIKNNTFENYKYMYETFVRNQIGSQFIMSIKKTDIKRYYNSLVDERHLKPATIDSIHTVLHQVFEMAVDDDYIRSNPTDNVLRELKKSHCFKTEKRRALTKPEQELFLDYLKNTPEAQYWYPIFAVMVGTGLRVGELTGLRWCDIDLEESIIDVNHTLVYYDHRTEGSKKGCYFNVNTTKTPAGMRQVPMLEFVKEAFLMEKERQELLGLHCEATVDGYTDFIFVNRFGQPQHQATLNKARLTKNPEIKYAGKDNDMAVARYTLAVNRRYKCDGEQEADFISCVTFGKSAEFAQKYLYKGMRIVIGGRISTGSYKDKDGKTIYTTDVIVEEHEFAQNKDSGAGVDSSETSKTDKDGFMEAKDGEIPFD